MTSGAKNPNEFNHFDIYQISDNFQLVVTHRSVRRTPSSEFAVLMEIKVTAYDLENRYRDRIEELVQCAEEEYIRMNQSSLNDIRSFIPTLVQAGRLHNHRQREIPEPPFAPRPRRLSSGSSRHQEKQRRLSFDKKLVLADRN
jgi:hypothetical protein